MLHNQRDPQQTASRAVRRLYALLCPNEGQVNRIVDLWKSGKINLNFAAAATEPEIRTFFDYCEYDDKQIIQDIVYLFLVELAEYIRDSKVSPELIQEFAYRIIMSEGHRLSFSGLAFWIHKIKNSERGYDSNMYFNPRVLISNLRYFISEQKNYINERAKKEKYEKIQGAAASKLRKQRSISEEMQRKTRDLIRKLEIKFPDFKTQQKKSLQMLRSKGYLNQQS